MQNSQPRKLPGSPGFSNGDADYTSDGDVSIHSGSLLSDVSIHSLSPLSDTSSKSEYKEQEMGNQEGGVAVEQDKLANEEGGAGNEEGMDTGSESEHKEQKRTMKGICPSRVSSSHAYQAMLTRIPLGRPVSRLSNSPGSMPKTSRSALRLPPSPSPLITESQGPIVIMPPMPGSATDQHIDSPSPTSQLRKRKIHQPPRQSQAGSVPSSPPPNGPPEADYEAIDRARRKRKVQGPGYYFKLLWAHFIHPLAQYAFDVAWGAMNYLKSFFVLYFAVFIMVSVVLYSCSLLYRNIEPALMTVCRIPGSSYFAFCGPVTSFPTSSGKAPDFNRLTKVQSSFEQVLEANKDAISLPAALEKCTLALDDLAILVKHSQLPSRRTLEDKLSRFSEMASEASDDLSTYNAEVGYTIDVVISTNRWTLHTLEGIAARDDSEGPLMRALAYMNPFSSTGGLEERIFAQYVQHVGRVDSEIERRIKQSEALLELLKRLKTQLNDIGNIAKDDGLNVARDHDELLSRLWTKLGGNRSLKQSFSSSLDLLKDVQSYRQDAVMHVSATLVKLRAIKGELKSLRKGVATRDLEGVDGSAPLRYYIGLVEKSVERLEKVRGESQQMEWESIRRMLDDDKEGRPKLPGKRETTTGYATVASK